MSCECEEYNEVESTETRRARKHHRCSACPDLIRPGDLYEYTFTIFDGEVSIIKHCARCARMFHAICRRQREKGLRTGVQYDLNCGHSWQEIFEEEPPPEIARLAFLTPDEMQKELATQ